MNVLKIFYIYCQTIKTSHIMDQNSAQFYNTNHTV